MANIKEYEITRPSYNMAVLDHRYAMMRDGTFIDLQTERGMKSNGMVHIDGFKVSYRSLLGRVFHKDNPKALVLPLKRRANKLFDKDKDSVYSKLYLPYELYRKYHDVAMSTYSNLRREKGYSCSKEYAKEFERECSIYGMDAIRYGDTPLYVTECGKVFTKQVNGFKYRKYNNVKQVVSFQLGGQNKTIKYSKLKKETWGK